MNLLIFFVLPLATILLAIVLEKILRSPILVAITFFAIYLLILFLGNITTDLATGLIAIIVYSILAFLTAYISRILKCICMRLINLRNCESISEIDGNGLVSVSEINNGSNYCGCQNSNNETGITDGIAISGNISPNHANGGRTGIVKGCYKRY